MLHITPPAEPITGPFDWRGDELAGRDDWQYHFTDDQIAELESAAQHATARRRMLTEVSREDFPLPTLAAELHRVAEELDNRGGFVQLRGLPVHRYSEAQSALIYWGVGLHLGIPMPQNGSGDLLTHVRSEPGEEGQKIGNNAAQRGYNSRKQLQYHTDSSDVVGLLCLHPAKSGGVSTIASAAAVHNRMLIERPKLLDALYQAYPMDNYGEEGPGEPPYHYSTIFTHHKGRLGVRWMPSVERTVAKYPELGEMSAALQEAFKLGDSLADELHLDIDFQPGDIQLLNNYAVMHSRTEFTDYPEPDRRRHLLRLWLTLHDGRELPTNFGRNPGVRDEHGGRGGLRGTYTTGHRPPEIRLS